MLTPEQNEQFEEIFDELGRSLDISKTQYEAAVTSYEFAGTWLAKEDSPIARYEPAVLPQGSFLLGTMIKPVHEEDDLDIDLVCQLTGKQESWTQYDLKQVVGNRLKANGTLARLLEEEGRRCWTLKHADPARFHLDILPAIVSKNFKIMLEKSLSEAEIEQAQELAIRITDQKQTNYRSSRNLSDWLKSNPFGYAAWFKERASLDIRKALALLEAVQPVPKYQKDKLPLQRIVQILKRHRDIMFNGDEDKPISIIITTLAARAYRKQTNVLDALVDVIDRIPGFIEERYEPTLGRKIKWIANPVNLCENFADKWPGTPKREEKFYQWLRQVRMDIENVRKQRGLHHIQEALGTPFGKREVANAFSSIGQKALRSRESGTMKMAAVTGTLGASGRTGVLYHNNFGKNE